MGRKTATLFTMVAFALFSTSCMTRRTLDVRKMPVPPKENLKVLSVVKTSGDELRFPKSEPGRVRGYSVLGTAFNPTPKKVEIEGPFSLVKRDADGNIVEVVDGLGHGYAVKQVLKEDVNKIAALVVDGKPFKISIPLSEIRLIQVRKLNAPLTILTVTGGLAAGAFLSLIYMIRRDYRRWSP